MIFYQVEVRLASRRKKILLEIFGNLDAVRGLGAGVV